MNVELSVVDVAENTDEIRHGDHADVFLLSLIPQRGGFDVVFDERTKSGLERETSVEYDDLSTCWYHLIAGVILEETDDAIALFGHELRKALWFGGWRRG